MRLRWLFWLFLGAIAGWGVLRRKGPLKIIPASSTRISPFLPIGINPSNGHGRGCVYPSFFMVHRRSRRLQSLDHRLSPLRPPFAARYPPPDSHRYAFGGTSVDPDGEDDLYNWPSLYAVEVGYWNLTDRQAAQIRDFLLRGGFLMWTIFTAPSSGTTSSPAWAACFLTGGS